MISGIFENCIGTKNLEATLKYWAEFGYREVNRGQFTAVKAKYLYKHDSALTSVRLQNGQTTTHGLIRVFAWEQANSGLQDTLPLVQGSRWFASLTSDIYTVWDAFSDDRENGNRWLVTEPVRAIEGIGRHGTGLHQRFVGVRELFVIGAETRQAFFQRYGYTRPGYGTISPDSPLQVSEGTHSSFVIADPNLVHFYADILGLEPLEGSGKISGWQNPSTRQTLLLEEGQEFYISVFTSPDAAAGVLQIYSPLYPTEDKRRQSQPGSLGLCLFTYQVEDLTALHTRVSTSNATQISAIVENEFGEASFGFFAPDGMYWVVLEKED